MRKMLGNKIVMMIITSAASSFGTWLMTAMPMVHAAFCGVQ